MLKKLKKMFSGNLSEEEAVIKNLLNYSFNPIKWEYKGLTVAEKRLITFSQFESLKAKYKK